MMREGWRQVWQSRCSTRITSTIGQNRPQSSENQSCGSACVFCNPCQGAASGKVDRCGHRGGSHRTLCWGLSARGSRGLYVGTTNRCGGGSGAGRVYFPTGRGAAPRFAWIPIFGAIGTIDNRLGFRHNCFKTKRTISHPKGTEIPSSPASASVWTHR